MFRQSGCALLAAASVFVSMMLVAPVSAARYADVPGYYEPGGGVDAVFHDPAPATPELYGDPLAALGGPDEVVELSAGTETTFVSLGGWSDDPATGTNDRVPGLLVGFSTPVRNGDGADLRIVGNAPTFTFYEPGFVEVARETTNPQEPGATADGWMDETFYLIRPGNFDQITDPRVGANVIDVESDPITYELTYSAPFEDAGKLGGYFDVTNEGDGADVFDVADAIDLDGESVSLADIAYVRLRGVTDSLFPYGTAIAPEVDYIEVLSDAPIVSGDLDGSGALDSYDVDDFEMALADRAAYIDTHNGLDADVLGDFDGSGGLDAFDVVGFEDALAAVGNAQLIPEPGAAALMALVALGLARRGGGGRR